MKIHISSGTYHTCMYGIYVYTYKYINSLTRPQGKCEPFLQIYSSKLNIL